MSWSRRYVDHRVSSRNILGNIRKIGSGISPDSLFTTSFTFEEFLGFPRACGTLTIVRSFDFVEEREALRWAIFPNAHLSAGNNNPSYVTGHRVARPTLSPRSKLNCLEKFSAENSIKLTEIPASRLTTETNNGGMSSVFSTLWSWGVVSTGCVAPLPVEAIWQHCSISLYWNVRKWIDSRKGSIRLFFMRKNS